MFAAEAATGSAACASVQAFSWRLESQLVDPVGSSRPHTAGTWWPMLVGCSYPWHFVPPKRVSEKELVLFPLAQAWLVGSTVSVIGESPSGSYVVVTLEWDGGIGASPVPRVTQAEPHVLHHTGKGLSEAQGFGKQLHSFLLRGSKKLVSGGGNPQVKSQHGAGFCPPGRPGVYTGHLSACSCCNK